MLNNGKIYNILQTIIRKEKEGFTVSPQQFSELLQMCSWEKANADFSVFELNQVITDSLRPLKSSSTIALTAGVGSLSGITDYWHATNAYSSTVAYTRVPVNIVSDVEFDEYVFSDLMQPQENWPIAKLTDDEIIVRPTTISSIELLYLKEPNEPFFDYYFDADDLIQYLTEGQQYTLQTGEEYRDGTTPPATVNSISTELSFPQNERVQVLYMILEKIGVSLNEQDALQYGVAREQKEEAQ